MIIGGHQAFMNFVGPDSIPGIERLRDCVAQMNKICKCQKHKRGVKNEQCNSFYINLVKTVMPNMIDYLKTKTSDNSIIFYHNGVHEILNVKLR